MAQSSFVDNIPWQGARLLTFATGVCRVIMADPPSTAAAASAVGDSTEQRKQRRSKTRGHKVGDAERGVNEDTFETWFQT